jgi:hypothetical protein
MGRTLNKIKAAAKILAGVIIASFVGSFISILAMLLTGAGALSFALGILIMLGSAALGAFIGGKWARNNVAEMERVRGIAVSSAAIYLAVNLTVSAVGSMLPSLVGQAKTGFWIQAAQIAAQSFVIYAASQSAMKKGLPKKETVE